MTVELMNFGDYSEKMILAIPQAEAVKDLQGIGYKRVGSAELVMDDFCERDYNHFVYEQDGRCILGCFKLPLAKVGFSRRDDVERQIGQNLAARMKGFVDALPSGLDIDFEGVFPKDYNPDLNDFNSYSYDKTPAGNFVRALAQRRIITGDLVLATQRDDRRKSEKQTHAFIVPEGQRLRYCKSGEKTLPEFYCRRDSTTKFKDVFSGFGRQDARITKEKVGSLCLQDRELATIVWLEDYMLDRVLDKKEALSRVRF